MELAFRPACASETAAGGVPARNFTRTRPGIYPMTAARPMEMEAPTPHMAMAKVMANTVEC